MKTVEQSVVNSMDGSNNELFPFLPYIFQDLWEIGSDPDVIINLIRKHLVNFSDLTVLDLGCGKGAVSIKIAQTLGCKCTGVDALSEFIDYAKIKAKECGVDKLCDFEVNDIRKIIKEVSLFDIIILGSIGPVLGSYFATLSTLSGCLNRDGIILIDDGYIDRDSHFTHPQIESIDVVLRQIEASGMQLIDEAIFERDKIKKSDDYIFKKVTERCGQLIKKYPEKKEVFKKYIIDQRAENEILEKEVVCSTMVVKKNTIITIE